MSDEGSEIEVNESDSEFHEHEDYYEGGEEEAEEHEEHHMDHFE